MSICVYTIGGGKGVPCTSTAEGDSIYWQPHIDYLATQREEPRGGAVVPRGGTDTPAGGAEGPRGGAVEPRGGLTQARGGAVEPPNA